MLNVKTEDGAGSKNFSLESEAAKIFPQMLFRCYSWGSLSNEVYVNGNAKEFTRDSHSTATAKHSQVGI